MVCVNISDTGKILLAIGLNKYKLEMKGFILIIMNQNKPQNSQEII